LAFEGGIIVGGKALFTNTDRVREIFDIMGNKE
jgi:hypothetical protein